MHAAPVHPHFGLEVSGLDVANLTASEATELRRLFSQYRLLLFRGLDLSGDEQVALGSIFGEVVDEGGDGKCFVFVSNAQADGVLADGKQLLFHSDNVFTSEPLDIVGLYGLRVAPGTAPTRFADTEWAADQLTESQRAQLEGAHGFHLSGFGGGSYRYRDAEVAPHHPRATHPVLRHNPRSGRTALFVSEQQTDRIIGWNPEKSEAMLSDLCALIGDPSNVYEHHWRQGDLVIWDNIALQHGRPALPDRSERTLRRVAAVASGADRQKAWTMVTLESERLR